MLDRIIDDIKNIAKEFKGYTISSAPEANMDIREWISVEHGSIPYSIEAKSDKIFYVASRREHPEETYGVLSLDSSSRKALKFQTCNVAISSVSILLENKLLVEYPDFLSLPASKILVANNVPFVALQIRARIGTEILERLERTLATRPIRIRSFNNTDFYSFTYNYWQIPEELRLNIENAALEALCVLYDGLSEFFDSLIVMIDGPIYPTPRICFSDSPDLAKYRHAYENLIRERIRVIHHLEKMGVGVLGIVKRLDYSYKLHRNQKILELLRAAMGTSTIKVEKTSDEVVVNMLIAKMRRAGYLTDLSFPIIIGGFEFEIRDRAFHKLMNMTPPKKTLYYIATPKNPYTIDFNVFRVEFLNRTFDMYGDEIPGIVLSRGISKTLGVPKPIHHADKVARLLSGKTYYYIGKKLARTIPMEYDSRIDLLEVMKELSEAGYI